MYTMPKRCAECGGGEFVPNTSGHVSPYSGLWECAVCGRSAEPLEARPVRCPTEPVPGVPDDEQILGCGGQSLEWDGREAWDCLDCGLFVLLEYLDSEAPAV